MHEETEMLKKLCTAISKELEEYSKKIEKSDGMSAGDLDAVDKLAHALKSIKTTIAMLEADDGYSGRMYSGADYYDTSNARGRVNARRDSMGRYSREGGYSYHDAIGDALEDIREALATMPEEKRRKAERLIAEMERI